MFCRAVRQDTPEAFPGKAKAACLAFPWRPPPSLGGGAERPHRLSNRELRGTPCSPEEQGPSPPQPPGPGALPGGADEFTVLGAEAEAGGAAVATRALASGGNMRSCFLTFNFLR